jgi:hypothetical protein
MTNETYKKIALWAIGEDTGRSSCYLAACVLGQPEAVAKTYPYDVDDFGRCYRLGKLLTPAEVVEGLNVAAKNSKRWELIRLHWLILCEFYEKGKDGTAKNLELYKYMKSIGL